MRKKCSKCKAISDIDVSYHEFGKTYVFCKICSAVLKQIKETGIISDFLKDDFGKLKISLEDRSIVNARIKRQKGLSPW